MDTKHRVFVYDIMRQEKRWVYYKYVESYPHLYTPISYKGRTIESIK